jgi:hypothetical protein
MTNVKKEQGTKPTSTHPSAPKRDSKRVPLVSDGLRIIGHKVNPDHVNQRLVIQTKAQIDSVAVTKDKTFVLDVHGFDGVQVQLLKKALEIGLAYGRTETVPSSLLKAFNKLKEEVTSPEPPPQSCESTTESN